jgi:hypothetical protein
MRKPKKAYPFGIDRIENIKVGTKSSNQKQETKRQIRKRDWTKLCGS